MSRLFVPALLLTASCGGEGGVRPPPEICDDRLDNDGDGLVDCDDEACGGLACTNGGGGGTTRPDPLDPVEILFDSQDCCDFTFGPGDCNKIVGSYTIANRTDEDGELDISCDTPGGGSTPAYRFTLSNQPKDDDDPRGGFSDFPIAPQSDVVVTQYYDCFTNQSFTTTCRGKITVAFDDRDEIDDIEYEPQATYLK